MSEAEIINEEPNSGNGHDSTQVLVLSKLTLKGMKCVPAACKLIENDRGEPVGGELKLAHIIGIATGIKTEEKDGQIFTAIVGSFEGTNLKTGTRYSSGKLYLPGGMHEMLASAFSDNHTDPVEFAMEISSRPADNPIGYEYTGRDIVNIVRADPLAAIRNRTSVHTVAAVAHKPLKTIEGTVEKKGGK